jgi:hypothetical protein
MPTPTHLAGEVGRVGAGEEHVGGGDLAGLARPLWRHKHTHEGVALTTARAPAARATGHDTQHKQCMWATTPVLQTYPHGGLRAEALDLLVREGGGDEGRPDGAGGHGVHADRALCQLQGLSVWSGRGTGTRCDATGVRRVVEEGPWSRSHAPASG